MSFDDDKFSDICNLIRSCYNRRERNRMHAKKTRDRKKHFFELSDKIILEMENEVKQLREYLLSMNVPIPDDLLHPKCASHDSMDGKGESGNTEYSDATESEGEEDEDDEDGSVEEDGDCGMSQEDADRSQ